MASSTRASVLERVFENHPSSGVNGQAGSQDSARGLNPVVTSLRSTPNVTAVPFGERNRSDSHNPERGSMGPLTCTITSLATEIGTFNSLVEGLSSLTSTRSTRRTFQRISSEMIQLSLQ